MVSETKNKLNKLFISTFIEWIARFSIERFWFIFWQYERPTNWRQFLARRHGILIYNCLYISPLTLWVRTPLRQRVLEIPLLYDKVCQWPTADRWFSPGTSVSSWPPRYNWNIVESGVKHHKTICDYLTYLWF